MQENDDDIMNIEQAAAFLNRPLSTMYESARNGRVPAQKIGRRWVFSRTALRQHLGQRAAPSLRLHPDDVKAIADEVLARIRSGFGGR